jgi:hypothetical protein
MIERKPGVGFCITAVLLMALLGYPLSAGPVCWL